MNCERSLVALVLAAIFMAPAVPVVAQIPEVNGPKCVPSAVSDCTGIGPGLHHPVSVNSAIRQQVVSTIADSFFQWMLSSNAQAAAKRDQMMAELKARQEEAVRQQKIAEAARLDAICKRLATTLKLNGVPALRLKDVDQSPRLVLKMGSDDSGHRGTVKRPAVIYQNAGSSVAYVNGIAVPTGSLQPQPTTSASASSASTPALSGLPEPPENSGISRDLIEGMRNPQNMTPQQLADAATLVDTLPQEEQQRLIAQAEEKAQLANAGQTASAPAALGQLQQAASASQNAAANPELVEAETQARMGFDAGASDSVSGTNQGANNQPSAIGTSGSAPVYSSLFGSGSGHPEVVQSAPVAASSATAHPKENGSTPPPATVALSLGSGSAGTAGIAFGAPILSSTAIAAPSSRIPRMTNEQLQTEICRARTMLTRIGSDSRKSSQEMDAMAREVQETRNEAIKAGASCFNDLLQKYIDDRVGERNLGFEKDQKKIDDFKKEIGRIVREHSETGTDGSKLETELDYLNAVYEFLHEGKLVPWVAEARCVLDFGYLATKVYLQQEHIRMLNDNLDSSSGALKAESSVSAFHKKLVDEALRRGMDTRASCR